jgi:hypothetical protein
MGLLASSYLFLCFRVTARELLNQHIIKFYGKELYKNVLTFRFWLKSNKNYG